MSYFGAKVISLPNPKPHENSDNLSLFHLTDPFELTVVGNTKAWEGIKQACYIPIDAITSEAPEFEFLGPDKRIKATKLRGIMSMGLLIPCRPHWKVGDDVTEELGIKKYDDRTSEEKILDDNKNNKDNQLGPSPSGEVKYTDIENIRKWKNVFNIGEMVVGTEKLHGQSARFVYQDTKLFVGSHKRWLKEGPTSWWKEAKNKNLEEILSKFPNKIFFAELFGSVQDLNYGAENGQTDLAFFDIYDISRGRYVDYQEMKDTLQQANLKMVPVLFEEQWPGLEEVLPLAEGNTLMAIGNNIKTSLIKEGVVFKTVVERFDKNLGRVILKLIGQGYSLRKQK